MLQSRKNVVDTLVEYARFYKQFHSFIISFCLNAVNPPPPPPPPPPKSTLYCFSTGRLEGLKYNIYFGERGGGTQGQGIWIFYRSVSTLLSLIVAVIKTLSQSSR